MRNILIYAVIIILSEGLAIFIFWFLARMNKKNTANKISGSSVIKGILERAFITFSMVNGITQSLTLFSALKIATRIKDEDPISNDYYLLGNLFSITLALIYSQLFDKILA